MKIVSTPNTNKTSPNFRMDDKQKIKLKETAKSRGQYIQDYMDLLFEKLDEIDKFIYE